MARGGGSRSPPREGEGLVVYLGRLRQGRINYCSRKKGNAGRGGWNASAPEEKSHDKHKPCETLIEPPRRRKTGSLTRPWFEKSLQANSGFSRKNRGRKLVPSREKQGGERGVNPFPHKKRRKRE